MTKKSDPLSIFDDWQVQLSGNDFLTANDKLIIEKGSGKKAKVFAKKLLGEAELINDQLLSLKVKDQGREFTLSLTFVEEGGKSVLYGTLIDKNDDIGSSGATAVFGADTEGR